jgi:hypothetical protein
LLHDAGAKTSIHFEHLRFLEVYIALMEIILVGNDFHHWEGGFIMNSRHFFAAVAMGLFVAYPSISLAQGSVTIQSPADGATLDALNENRLVYDFDPGPRGDHVHVYVDNKEVALLRQKKGSFLLESLSTGKHELCIKVVNKAHVPIGIGKCVQVTVN